MLTFLNGNSHQFLIKFCFFWIHKKKNNENFYKKWIITIVNVKVVQLMAYNLFSISFICYFSHFLHLLEKNHIKGSNTSCLHEHNYKFNQTKPNLDMKFLCRLDNPIQKKSCQNKISHHCVCGLLFIVNLISSRIHRMNVTFYVSVPNAIFLQAPEFNG